MTVGPAGPASLLKGTLMTRTQLTPKKKLAALAAAAATAFALGVAGAAHADTSAPTTSSTTTSSTTPSSTNPSGADGHHGGGPGSGHRGGFGFGDADDLTALATELGVDKSALSTALGAVRDELKPATGARPAPGTRPDVAAMQKQLATTLASKLGISATTVDAALTELRTAHDADRSKAFADRLAQAVKDHKLTQTEADAVTKAAKAGVIGMGGRR